jgi:hypothetical protein
MDKVMSDEKIKMLRINVMMRRVYYSELPSKIGHDGIYRCPTTDLTIVHGPFKLWKDGDDKLRIGAVLVEDLILNTFWEIA